MGKSELPKNLKVTAECVSKLNSLLQSPELGMMTWHGCVMERLQELQGYMNGMGIKVQIEGDDKHLICAHCASIIAEEKKKLEDRFAEYKRVHCNL